MSDPDETGADETGADEAGADEIVPDDRDWTWVLDRVCPECEVDVRSFDVTLLPALLRRNAATWVEVLNGEPATVVVRTKPDRWSVLEYGCHVRDVFELYDYRLCLMLNEDGPRYPNWDQDATAIERSYGTADPAAVATELLSRAETLAARFESVEGDAWSRTGSRSDGAAFTIETFARYLLHDPLHHLWDVGRSDVSLR